MKRLLLAGAAALTLTFTASACGSVHPDAAVVNGVAIKARDVESDVAGLDGLRAKSAGTPAAAALPMSGIRQVLSYEIIARMLETDGANALTVDQAAIDQADAGLAGADAYGDGWKTLPTEVRTRLARASAIVAKMQNSSASQDDYTQKLTDLFARTPVKVNARYGVWDPTSGQVVSGSVALTSR